jgi:hypothetical protein
MSEPIANLFYLLELLSTPDTVEHFRDSLQRLQHPLRRPEKATGRRRD